MARKPGKDPNVGRKIFDGLIGAVRRKMTAAQQQDMPKTVKGQASALLRDEKKHGGEKGAVKRVAERLGITPAAVYRYLSGKRKTPPKEIADRLGAEVRKIAKPRIRDRIMKKAKQSPVKIDFRASIGYTSSQTGNKTPDGRMRNFAKTMPEEYSSRLWDALRDGDEAKAEEVICEFYQNEYLHEGGGANVGTEVEIMSIDHIDFDIR
ncbi:hypothetical protein [Streptomyces sp. NPDC048623]|uniref:telomere-protecting terminal protein Tpg n=1 Tax=Streptomyces sp. NPDC048623 TaxID=3155761 RepID=UPI003446CA76